MIRLLRFLTVRDYIIVALGLTVLYFAKCGGGSDDVPGTITHTVTDTVVVKEIVTQIVREANRDPSLIERISEREIKPREVEVSPAPAEGDTLQGDPNWGLCVVEKEGTTLAISALNNGCKEGEEGQRLTYDLPNSDSDFVLRSGSRPSRLRVDRRFSLIRLDIKARVFGGVNTSGGEPTVGLALEGPVSIGTDRFRASPTVLVGYGGDGVRVGGTLEFRLGG